MRFLRDRTGTSAIEFAVLSPIFFLLMMGILAYGIYFGASHSIQQIAADAARAAVAGLSEEERRSIAASYVSNHAGGYILVDPEKIAVDVEPTASDASAFAVSVSYDARQLPIWNLLSGLPLPDVTIARRSVIRMGGA
ncbi:MAG TPA: TadE/TadG family type IV pilus assembly protein [Rhizobiaceae bacterium]|nr:TadE/TadG family type IV pilus assembly protein [Rhizobiaceae bacterium]